jgi:integrase
MQVQSPPEVRKLLEAAKGHRLEALFVLAALTGLRQSEVFGLQWQDVDLEQGVVTVRLTLVEAAGRISFSEPKTKQSRRRVEIPSYVLSCLKDPTSLDGRGIRFSPRRSYGGSGSTPCGIAT